MFWFARFFSSLSGVDRKAFSEAIPEFGKEICKKKLHWKRIKSYPEKFSGHQNTKPEKSHYLGIDTSVLIEANNKLLLPSIRCYSGL
jgi:hypothetical protein